MMASKIIVVGDASGHLTSLFAKLSILHAKNNFSFAIVDGNFLNDETDDFADLLANKIHIPLPTYFTVGLKHFPQRVIDRLSQGEDICENLHFLGKRSITKTLEGIRIVSLGGRLDDTIITGLSNEQHLPFHTIDDAKALRGANTADILLTASLPSHVRNGSKVPIPSDAVETLGYDHISDLCAALKPRYHFSFSQYFYEREPFFHAPSTSAPESRLVTRFISIAAYGNSHKQKAIYAFSLQKTADLSSPLPLGCTASPFTTPDKTMKRPALDLEPYSRFSNGDSHTYHRHKRSRKEKQQPTDPSECFFCLSNPNLATHLVASIGEEAYLTIAKGPLTLSSTNSALGLSFPGHMLIIPLTHSPTIALISEEGLAAKTYAEMNKYRTALQSMVADCSTNRLGTVTYEISRADGVHTHWQLLPVPTTLIRNGLVEAAFRVEAENMSYPAFQIRDPGIGQGDSDFFRVWIWTSADADTEEISKCITISLPTNIRFDLQFGRRVLAKLLHLEKRVSWRDCGQTEEEEKADVEAFKVAFKEWDFT